MRVSIPLPAGDLIDRITILTIKTEHIPHETVRGQLRRELRLLEAVRDRHAEFSVEAVRALQQRLYRVNLSLWKAEDRVRALAARKDFGVEFVTVARRIHRTNDRRARLKREIDRLTHSDLLEAKWYSSLDERSS